MEWDDVVDLDVALTMFAVGFYEVEVTHLARQCAGHLQCRIDLPLSQLGVTLPNNMTPCEEASL